MPQVSRCVLFSVDGMRPDALMAADAPFVKSGMQHGLFTLASRSTMPTATLPCHTSMFFGVEPERHGITTNVWAPPVRPVVGLIEALHRAGRTCAFFYNWEQLRDLTPPGNWSASYYMSNVTDEGGTGDVEIAELAVARLKRSPVDFAFVYLGHTDEAGHLHGWMSAQYLAAIGNADRCISEVCRAAGEGANVIVTSDHGGHGKSHGTDMPEDILTPIVMWGPDVPAMGQLERQARITDIAPTILDLFGVPTPEEWIGASLLRGA